jgi:proteasome lid subunit RPN8/RPN11
MTVLVLPRKLVEEILSDAKRRAPQEACGVIAGEVKGERKLALAVYPCRNVSRNPLVRYTIAPEDLVKALSDIEGRGMEVLGFYHSHPMGSVAPSGIDHAKASWDGASYVIVNLKGEVASWVWEEEAKRFRREKVVVED